MRLTYNGSDLFRVILEDGSRAVAILSFPPLPITSAEIQRFIDEETIIAPYRSAAPATGMLLTILDLISMN